MRPEFLGDSYDVVKRFFCATLQSLGYTVYIDPLFTGTWSGEETTFYRFLGVKPLAGATPTSAPTALFLDPDTGVNQKGGLSHVSYERIVAEAKGHPVVFVFDQAFSRAGEAGPKLQAKLTKLAELGCSAFYYASHAHFLFVSREPERLRRLRTELVSLGLPASRLVEATPNPTIERDDPRLRRPLSADSFCGQEGERMKALQRTLAIVAALFLAVQTVRHAYVLWLEPRASVLDRFDRPLKEEIAAAASVEELLRRYEPVRKDVDRVKAERRAADPTARFTDEQEAEPFKSESALREAITSWEQRAKELHALWFYWLVGVLLAGVGLVCYLRGSRWLGLTFLIIGFSEIIYWTTPTFLLGGGVQEFDRLVAHKVALSAISVVLLAVAIRLLHVFDGGTVA